MLTALGVLENGKKALLEKGLVKGCTRGSAGEYCIGSSIGMWGSSWYDFGYTRSDYQALSKAAHILRDAVVYNSNYRNVQDFNDAEETTLGDVLNMLDLAISKAME